MPIKIKINDPKVGPFDMDWEDTTRPPSGAEIDDYIAKNVKPKQEAPISAAPKVKGIWDSLNRPLLPNVKMPGTNEQGQTEAEAKDRVEHPIRSFISDAASEIGQRTYDKIIQPMSSPVGLGVTGLATAAGIPELAPVVKPLARLGLGGLAVKGAYDAKEPVREAIKQPNVNTVSDAALAVAGPIAMGAGALHMGGPSVKGNVNPEIASAPKPEVKPEVRVNIPEGIKIQMRPGFEDVLGIDEETKQVYVKDAARFKEGLGNIDGPDAPLKAFSREVRGAIPSTDYNENYNPDAVVDSYVKGTKSTEEAFKDWVNQRSGAKWTGENIKEGFSSLDNNYAVTEENQTHPMIQLDEALKGGAEPELERYFNQLHEEARKAGVQNRQLQLGYQEDYVPQMWANSPEEIGEVFKEVKRVGLKPTFSMRRLFEDYQTGIEKGLTPRFDKPSDLVASYAQYVDKFVADKNFFDQLQTNGLLKTRNQLSPEEYKSWEALDPKRTPIQRFVSTTKEGTETNVSREYYGPKKLVKVINEYLQGDDPDSILGKISKAGSQVKSLVMTSGIPGTALNIHGTNVGVGRMWIAGGSEMVGRYLKYAVNPEAATQFTRNNLYDAPRFVRAGLKFSPEFLKRQPSSEFETTTAKVLRLKHNYFERPLFGQVIPALQLELAQTFEKGYLSRGIEPELATRLAAHDANTFVSNMNYDELMRNKDIRQLSSALSFAPSWLETHARIGKGVVSALLNPSDPKGYVYRKAAGQVLKAYLAVGSINKVMTGKFDPLALHLGKDSKGKETSLPVLGSGDDFVKIPVEIALAAWDGKPFDQISNLVKYRLASPVQFAVDFLAKQKAQGGDLLRDRKGALPRVFPQGNRNSQVENLGELAVRTMAPRYVGSGIDALRGPASGLQVSSDLVGLQLKQKNHPKIKAPF